MFTSTLAGRSMRMSASTVLGVGSRMSMSRLCVRISKCSRESLYLCGERMTQYTFFSVGSGTGPTTRAPVRVTVSTILRAEASMASWSYALSLMRIFCPAMVVGRPSLFLPLVHGCSGWHTDGPAEHRSVVGPLVVAPVHEVGRVALDPHTGPRITRAPWGGHCVRGLTPGSARADQPRVPTPYAQPVKDA